MSEEEKEKIIIIILYHVIIYLFFPDPLLYLILYTHDQNLPECPPIMPVMQANCPREPGAHFSKVPIVNRHGKLSLFTLKIQDSIVLHLT